MSQAYTNIGPVNAPCKAAPRSAQRQAAQPTRQIRRPATSAEQRVKLSAAQFAYMANDPRWAEHRRKLAAIQEARRMTLFENEITAILAMRKEGKAFSYIAQKIGVSRDIITRELTALGLETGRVKAKPMTLFENEVTAILEMRKKGRTFSYIEQEIGVSREVIRRELARLGVETGRVKSDRRAHRGKGFWRSFD